MRRWLLLVALLLASGSGCAMMDDLVYGPEPYYNTAPPQSSCSAPAPAIVQTGEPPR
ncbi:MAG TPA: hypothetical protein VFE62_22220 [Gemmataceae bacterium]|nr:hypothetical protein [Gemmataceae bacterium]